MKKLFTFLVLFGVCSSSFAFLTQSNWRWRNNNGTETSATWKAAQNEAITYNTISEVLRLRLEIYNTNSDPTAVEDSLQYTTTPAVSTSWINILAKDETRAFILAGAESTVSQNTPTTTQITGNSYAFVPGKMMADSTVLKLITLPASNRSEFEWAIKGTAQILPNTTYYFRQWGATANGLPPGVTYPSLTTANGLPIKLSYFTVGKEGSRVKLEWSTLSEQNNDRFEVEKSNNSQDWNTIATVPGHGSSSQVHNYTIYDENPLNGINYYRLKQYDFDSHIFLSEIKSLKFDGVAGLIITVSPNPAKDGINFKLNKSFLSTVTAVLNDANGKIIYTETFRNLQANTNTRLNLNQKPSPGLYVLKLQGQGISETIKVVVQ
ncbi:MAG: T9SS type A sorting domain-containing protein [Bacteroidetes bacterium]|nr:T9SS type A sorting domain-containing protein [Bacteroidota bacterium]